MLVPMMNCEVRKLRIWPAPSENSCSHASVTSNVTKWGKTVTLLIYNVLNVQKSSTSWFVKDNVSQIKQINSKYYIKVKYGIARHVIN